MALCDVKDAVVYTVITINLAGIKCSGFKPWVGGVTVFWERMNTRFPDLWAQSIRRAVVALFLVRWTEDRVI